MSLPHRSKCIVTLLCLSVLCLTIPSSAQQTQDSQTSNSQNSTTLPPVPSTLFSITSHSHFNIPSVPVYGFRLWDTGTFWLTLNPSQGVYDFTALDTWIAAAQAAGKDLIYTFGEIPDWASSNPSLVCGTGGAPSGSCAPPNDVTSTGGGTDQHFKDFVTAIVTHVGTQSKYWEMWNEPTVPGYWQGTDAQLLRMAQDAYGIIKSINPNAVVTTPSPSTGIYGVSNWMGPYLALGGGNYADIISFHGYSWSSTWGVWPQPEDIVPLVENLKAVLVTYGQSKKPLWCTEGSWGDTSGNGFTDPDLRAAYLSRHYILQESEGVVRYYWFAWDNADDGLWSAATGMTKAGTAYGQVESWLVGLTPSGKCVQNGTVWTCNYTKSGGYQAQAIWNTSKSCSNGSCSTSSRSVGTQYLHYKDVAGGTHSVSNHAVPVGAKPIFLYNQ